VICGFGDGLIIPIGWAGLAVAAGAVLTALTSRRVEWRQARDQGCAGDETALTVARKKSTASLVGLAVSS